MNKVNPQPAVLFSRVSRWVWAISISGVLLLGLNASYSADGSKQNADRLPPEIARFIKDKEAQARELARKLNITVAPEVWSFLRSAATAKPSATTNAFETLKKGTRQYEGSNAKEGVSTPIWQIVVEILLAVEPCVEDPGYAMAIGRGVLDTVPKGSIYFCGTDPGRGMPTALSRSHAKGDPVFTITQNALADGHYLTYLRAMYGDQLRTPSDEESQRAFQDYLADAQKRFDHDRRFPNEPRQIKPGEDVKVVNDRVQVSGHVAVMGINALLVKKIFDANPDRDFYIQESFPLEWTYPHLSPRGFIFKLNRAPLDSLSDQTLAEDRRFWREQQKKLIGDWLTPATSVKEVCDFSKKVFQRKDYSGFNGDRRYVQSASAPRMYSKLRVAIGGLYAWRASRTTDREESRRMKEEADFAFRQALALCPSNTEVIFRCVNQFVTDQQIEDAIQVAVMAQAGDPDNSQLAAVLTELDRMKREKR